VVELGSHSTRLLLSDAAGLIDVVSSNARWQHSSQACFSWCCMHNYAECCACCMWCLPWL
jgi:hypothetical protein